MLDMSVACQIDSNVMFFLAFSFLADTPDDLIELQTREWGPLLKWFNERYFDYVDSCTKSCTT